LAAVVPGGVLLILMLIIGQVEQVTAAKLEQRSRNIPAVPAIERRSRRLLDTRDLGLGRLRHRDPEAYKGERSVKVNLRDGRGVREMPWSKAYHKAKQTGTGLHEHLHLDPDAGGDHVKGGKPRGSGFRDHQRNHQKASKQGYYNHLEKIATDPKGVERWAKRVQQAEAMREKPGQHRHAQAHHRAQPRYTGKVLTPHRGDKSLTKP